MSCMFVTVEKKRFALVFGKILDSFKFDLDQCDKEMWYTNSLRDYIIVIHHKAHIRFPFFFEMNF